MNLSNGVFSPNLAGYYQFNASIRLDSSTSAYVRIILSINGVWDLNGSGLSISGNGFSSDFESLVLSALIKLDSNDNVRLRVQNFNDSNVIVHTESVFSGMLVREL